MKSFYCEQASPEWHTLRRGIPTASEFHRILTPKRRKMGRGAQSYLEELVGDSMSVYYRQNAENYMSRSARWGQQAEEEARRLFALSTGLEVERVGFCTTDDGRFGCSPDGLIGEDSGVEIKCPEAKTHTKYLLSQEVPTRYLAQVHGAMIVTGRPSWWFISYAPGLSALILETKRNDYTEALAAALDKFWDRYQQALELVKSL